MSAAPIYFHHYPMSFVGKKVRAILGCKGMTWHSVMQPQIMPKPDLLAWKDRIKAFGQGTVVNRNAAESIANYLYSTSVKCFFSYQKEVFQAENNLPLGTQVSITAESFEPERTVGTLLAATRTRYSQRRDDVRAGAVHVHLPRVGFVMAAV